MCIDINSIDYADIVADDEPGIATRTDMVVEGLRDGVNAVVYRVVPPYDSASVGPVDFIIVTDAPAIPDEDHPFDTVALWPSLAEEGEDFAHPENPWPDDEDEDTRSHADILRSAGYRIFDETTL